MQTMVTAPDIANAQAFSSASQLPGDRSLVQADSDRHASVAPQSTPPLATTSPARPLSEAISEARPQTGVDVSVLLML